MRLTLVCKEGADEDLPWRRTVAHLIQPLVRDKPDKFADQLMMCLWIFELCQSIYVPRSKLQRPVFGRPDFFGGAEKLILQAPLGLAGSRAVAFAAKVRCPANRCPLQSSGASCNSFATISAGFRASQAVHFKKVGVS